MPFLIERVGKDSQRKTNSDEPIKEAWKDDDVDYSPETITPDQQFKAIQTIMKRLQFVLTIFGMYVPGQCGPLNGDEKKPIFVSKAIFYNILVLLLLWFVTINRVVFILKHLKTIESAIILHLISLTWHFHTALNATLILKGSHPRFGNGKVACSIWNEKVLPLFIGLKLNMGVVRIRRQVLRACIVGIICIVFNSVMMGFLLFYPDTLFYSLMPELLISPLPVNAVTKVISLVITAYINVAWIMPPIYCITLCTIIQSSFKSCAEAIEIINKDSKDKNLFPECIYRQRLMHLNICKVVEVFDKDVKYILANISVTNLVLTCILVYQIFKTELDTFTIITYVFWLTYCIVSTGVVCSYAAGLNKAAHSPLDCLYETGMKGVTMDQLGQVNLFVAKLTAAPIGFSVLDFLVITKELILTVVGLIVTYSFVLLQF